MDQKTQSLFEAWKEEFNACRDELTELDSVGGDGDMGIVMMDGFQYLHDEITAVGENDLGKLFYTAGKLFNKAASSSMGTLLSCGFMECGKRLKGKQTLSQPDLIILVEGMAEGVERMGKAKEGEKTFLDAIYPALRAMKEHAQSDCTVMMEAAKSAARQGVINAKEMKAVHGRLAFRGEGSIGITDPGSVAAYHFVNAITSAVRKWDHE